jgi:hypothetical protein
MKAKDAELIARRMKVRKTKKAKRKYTRRQPRVKRLKKQEPFQIVIQGTIVGLPKKERRTLADEQERLATLVESFNKLDLSWGIVVARSVVLFAGKRIEIADEMELQVMREGAL